jgi:hypothetical protein
VASEHTGKFGENGIIATMASTDEFNAGKIDKRVQ